MSAKFRLEDEEVAGSGHNFIGVAGEALANRQLVRIGAAGTLLRADAGATATLPAMGIVLAAALAGQNVLVLLKGWVGLSTWAWTSGDRLYVSDTAGALAAAAGTITQDVGVAYSATQIWFDPQGLNDGAVVGAHILATTGPHTNTLPLTDLAVGVQGEIIHRGAADWGALAVGAAGQALLSGGAGADVSWGAPAPAAHASTHESGGSDETRDIELDPGLADETGSGLKAIVTVGENVVTGDVLYMKADGKYWKADADAAAEMPAKVLVLDATIAADAAGTVLHEGYYRNDDLYNWTLGNGVANLLFADVNPGLIVQFAGKPAGAGDQVQVVGWVVTANVIYWRPSLELVEVS